MSYVSISLFILKGSERRNSNRAGIRREELIYKPQADAVFGRSLQGLLSLLFFLSLFTYFWFLKIVFACVSLAIVELSL